MDSTQLPRHHFQRRQFLLIVGVPLLICGLIRLALPNNSPATPIADNLIAGLLLILGLPWVFHFFSPPPPIEAKVSIIPARARSEVLEQALQLTETWQFRGGTGRWNRSVAIPTLASRARRTNRPVSVHLQLIDPADNNLCLAYADYRNKVRSGAHQNWDAQRVRTEVLATILSAYTAKSRDPLLTLDVTLIANLHVFRVDLSDVYALLTKEDPQDEAVQYSRGTLLYDATRLDLELSARLGKSITPNGPIDYDATNAKSLKAWFAAAGIRITNADDLPLVIRTTQEGRNPYA